MTVSHSSHVFLSYARADGSFVSQLQSDLQARGITVWIDHEDNQPGTPNWEISAQGDRSGLRGGAGGFSKCAEFPLRQG